jgi:hypothetical protein
VEEHLIERKVEQFSHSGKTPFGYTASGKELGHTGDSPKALSDPAIQEIVDQVKKYPLLGKNIKPVETAEDFKSAFKSVTEKTASSASGRVVHH